MSSQADEIQSVETFRDVFDEAGETLYFLNPPEALLRPLIESLRRSAPESTPTVRVVGDGTILRRFRKDFEAAATAAELVADGTLDLRTHERTAETPVLVGPDGLFVPVVVGGVNTTVAARGTEFVADVVDHCRANWERGDRFSLRTPPLATVRETLGAALGAMARADFDAALETVESGRDPTDFDAVLVALLIGGKHEALHYNVSKWGEDIGLASKATFSRKKGQLEEMGVVTTEKVAVEMGRPRQRLFLTDDYHERLRAEGIAGIVSNVLY